MATDLLTRPRSRRWPFGRTREAAVPAQDVVAMRFDEEAVAADLARWCGGQVVLTEDLEGAVTTTVYVPTRKGPRPALLGDWIVQTPHGEYVPVSNAEFKARFQPQQ